MARITGQGGHKERQERARNKALPGKFEKNYMFVKGDTTAILSTYNNCNVFEVFTDRDCSQHLDWNEPECKIFGNAMEKMSTLEVISKILDNGFKYLENA